MKVEVSERMKLKTTVVRETKRLSTGELKTYTRVRFFNSFTKPPKSHKGFVMIPSDLVDLLNSILSTVTPTITVPIPCQDVLSALKQKMQEKLGVTIDEFIPNGDNTIIAVSGGIKMYITVRTNIDKVIFEVKKIVLPN